MLKTPFGLISVVYIFTIIALQLWLIFQLQLFGDESFYWLEGQFLSLSYTDLPGWSAWMTRLGTSIFGNHYFAVRILSYMGFLSVFYVIYLLNKNINSDIKYQQLTLNILLVLSIPLYALVSIMALPDVWIVVFALWIIYFFISAIKNNNTIDWLILGAIIACSLNVHVRMWIWLFFAGLVFLFCFRNDASTLKSALILTLPVALLGLVPVIIFNIQTDFSLFSFQFAERHPWKFQWQNFSFIVSQLLVISPIILWVWFKNVKLWKLKHKNNPIISWIVLTSIIHLLFYAFMSVFADGLRTTVHWLLVSYVPVLAITSVFNHGKILNYLAVASGSLVTLMVLLFVGFNKSDSSNLQSRLLDNSLGWKELSQEVKQLQKQLKINHLITDYFMTASELAFELDNASTIKVLPHKKSIKHGRQKQLQIMGILLQNPQEFKQEALLVVEDSGLKLQDKGKYYQQLCEYFKHVKLIKSLQINNSKKQFYFFKVDNQSAQACQMPPLFYVEQKISDKQIIISGWVILHNSSIDTLALATDGTEHKIEIMGLVNHGIGQIFPEINDLNSPNNAFKISLPLSEFKNNTYQIMATGNNQIEYISRNYFID